MRHKLPSNIAKEYGRKNYTKEELRQREAEEVVMAYDNIAPSPSLPEHLHERFWWYVSEFKEHGIVASVDGDAFSRYVMTEWQYWQVTEKLEKISPGSKKYLPLLQVQDKLFKNLRSIGNDLGLTMVSRMKITKPKKQEDDKPQTNAQKLFRVVK